MTGWMFAEQLPPNHSMLNAEFEDVEFPFGSRLGLCCRDSKARWSTCSVQQWKTRNGPLEKQGQITITSTGNKGRPIKRGHWGIEFIFIHYKFKYVPKLMYFFHLYLEALEVHKCDYFQCQISHEPASSISEQMEEHFFFFFFLLC